jgi:hypothetical protein
MVRNGPRVFMGSFVERFRKDEDFRLNVTYAMVVPVHVGLLAAVFWWSLVSSG